MLKGISFHVVLHKLQCLHFRLTVAFMERDSTTTYFSFTPGLFPPTEITTRKDLKVQDTELAEDNEFEGEI